MDMNGHELKKILAKGETLTVEFKSDVKGLPDRDLVAAVVAMANTEGVRMRRTYVRSARFRQVGC